METTKICKQCGEEKELTEYHKHKISRLGVLARCKLCVNENNRKKYHDNIEHEHERAKKYYSEHKAERREYERRWNKESNTRREYIRNRYHNDPQFRLNSLIYKRLGHAVRKYNAKKNQRTFEYLGCTIEHLMEHLQKTAIDNGYIDFDIYDYNAKEYHIDHIIPMVAITELVSL